MLFKKTEVLGTLFYALGAALFSFGFGTTYWRFNGTSKTEVLGLWTLCGDVNNCAFLGWWTSAEVYMHIYITRYILFVPAILIPVIFFLISMNVCCSVRLFRVIGILALVSAIFTLGGDGVFAGLCYRYPGITCANLSYSYYINISSAIMFIVSSILMLSSKNGGVHPSDEWEY